MSTPVDYLDTDVPVLITHGAVIFDHLVTCWPNPETVALEVRRAASEDMFIYMAQRRPVVVQSPLRVVTIRTEQHPTAVIPRVDNGEHTGRVTRPERRLDDTSISLSDRADQIQVHGPEEKDLDELVRVFDSVARFRFTDTVSRWWHTLVKRVSTGRRKSDTKEITAGDGDSGS